MKTSQSKEKYVGINGLQFHFRDWGGRGFPILLLHGLASHCGIWDLVAPILARHARVFALDLRGHGAQRQARPRLRLRHCCRGRHPLLPHRRPAQSSGGRAFLGRQRGRASRRQIPPPSSPTSSWSMAATSSLHPLPGWTWEKAREELSPPRFGQVTLQQVTDRIKGGSLAPIHDPCYRENPGRQLLRDAGRICQAQPEPREPSEGREGVVGAQALPAVSANSVPHAHPSRPQGYPGLHLVRPPGAAGTPGRMPAPPKAALCGWKTPSTTSHCKDLARWHSCCSTSLHLPPPFHNDASPQIMPSLPKQAKLEPNH